MFAKFCVYPSSFCIPHFRLESTVYLFYIKFCKIFPIVPGVVILSWYCYSCQSKCICTSVHHSLNVLLLLLISSPLCPNSMFPIHPHPGRPFCFIWSVNLEPFTLLVSFCEVLLKCSRFTKKFNFCRVCPTNRSMFRVFQQYAWNDITQKAVQIIWSTMSLEYASLFYYSHFLLST